MLTLNDGRSELWQWDTGRRLSVDADCTQVHFSNKVFGRSVDVDVVDGVASIPDILLHTDKELTAWAFVGTSENGYTKISKVFKVNRRNKPADYVFTPPEQTTLGELVERLDKIEESQDPDAIKNAVDKYFDENPLLFEETDPTVYDWAKQPTKPSYTASEVGALPADTVIPTIPDNVSEFRNDAGYLTEHQDLTGYATEQYVRGYAQPKGDYLTEVPAGYAKTEDIPTKPEDIGAQPEGDYALRSEIPSVPVQSVNGQIGAVKLRASDVGAMPNTYTPPNQTAEQVGADPKGTAASAVSQHNTDDDSHNDIRLELVALKALIDALDSGKLNASELTAAINTALAQAKASGEFDGKNGTSVTVQSVSESAADGGDNVVTFSDGKTLTVKNGKTGNPGYTPKKGVDYFTAADQEEIVQQVIAALGTPVFGTVDADKNITLTGNLVDGTYKLWFDNKDGKVVELCTYEQGGIAYTNWLPKAEELTSTAVYNGKGWKENTRLNTDGTDKTGATGYVATGLIPCSNNAIIRVKSNVAVTNSESSQAICFFDINKNHIARFNWATLNTDFGDVVRLKINSDGSIEYDFRASEWSTIGGKNVGWCRLTFPGINDSTIITVNEEIPDSGETYTNPLPLAINADGTLYNGGQGWKTGYRLNSSGTEVELAGMMVTGFIPVKVGDTVYLENVGWGSGEDPSRTYIWVYDASFTKLRYALAGSVHNYTDYVRDSNNNVVQFTVSSGFLADGTGDISQTAYMRINCEDISADSIVTVNQPIV